MALLLAAALVGSAGAAETLVVGNQEASAPGGSRASVYFERRSVELSQEALATIAKNAKRLKADPNVSVTLVGYTDEAGSSSYGIALAQRRTSVVADALVAIGVDPRQIRTTAYGQEASDAPCETDSCALRYRRVEFKYLQPQTADVRWGTSRDAPH